MTLSLEVKFMLLYIIFKVVIIGILFSLCIFIYEMKFIEVDEYRYQIKHFKLNWLLILIYVLGYFTLLFWIRYQSTKKDTDLKLIYYKIKEWLSTSYIDMIFNPIILLLLLFCIVLLLRLIHEFFIIQLTKRFLILDYYEVSKIFHKQRYSIFGLSNFITEKIIFRVVDIFPKGSEISEKVWRFCIKIKNYMLYKMPTMILYVYFIYEMLWNNCILTTTFYKYLLFYTIYYIYKKFCFFTCYSDWDINPILFEMYYKQRSIWYVNIPMEYQESIRKYLRLGLTRNPNKDADPLLDNTVGGFGFAMMCECKFVSEDGLTYKGGPGVFVEETNDRQDVSFPFFEDGRFEKLVQYVHNNKVYSQKFISRQFIGYTSLKVNSMQSFSQKTLFTNNIKTITYIATPVYLLTCKRKKCCTTYTTLF